MGKEIFKDIPGFEGKYQVSNKGRVKSLPYKKWMPRNKCYAFFKERILSIDSSSGYARVELNKQYSPKKHTVHSLVAMAFLNHLPNGKKLVVNHINFDKLDNRVDNLEIVTMRENSNLKHIPSRSKYVGVHYRKDRDRWVARITYGKSTKYISSHKDEYSAHLTYQDELIQQRLKPA